jgi:ribose 5-phosphate isomerase B
MNVFCLGGKVIGTALAWELVQTFLSARFTGAERFQRRLAKIEVIENRNMTAMVTSLPTG